ncbi:hypothetical protein LINPERPRIM_LOCUS20917 [Linum perenne]
MHNYKQIWTMYVDNQTWTVAQFNQEVHATSPTQ